MDEVEQLKSDNERMWEIVLLIVGATQQQNIGIGSNRSVVPKQVVDDCYELYNERLNRRK